MTRLLIVGLVVLLLLAVRGASLRGILLPVRVQGGSMADFLLGDHFALDCRDCRFAFRCDAQRVSIGDTAVCPNCGFGENRIRREHARRGQRVLIDSSSFRRRPSRWDVLALASDNLPGQLETKRLVGLPGELVELRDGDVWIDGLRAQKTPRQFRSVAITVHDDRYRPHGTSESPRWRNATGAGLWKTTSQGYRITAPASISPPTRRDSAARWHWLRYQHQACMPSAWPPETRMRAASILDYYCVNQDFPRGRMNVARDIRLMFNVRLAGSGALAVELVSEQRRLRLVWNPEARELCLFENGRQVASNRSLPAPRGRDFPVEVAVCDGQVWFAFDGRIRLRHRLEAARGEIAATVPRSERPSSIKVSPIKVSPIRNSPIRIGARGPIRVELDAILIARDIYYFHAQFPGQPWSAGRRLGRDEYLLLGDNGPVSRDSRHWSSPAAPGRRILGTVLKP